MSEKNFYLHIDGKPVKVSKEVYQEYYRGERKETYFMQDLKMERMTLVSVNKSMVAHDCKGKTCRFFFYGRITRS